MTVIFQRLDVNNRAQAVARGAALGLLPPAGRVDSRSR